MNLDPIEKILLGRDLAVLSWVRKGYMELITREATPKPEIGKRIGYTESFYVFQLREWWRDVLCVLSAGSPTPASLAHLDRRVRLTFAKELSSLARLGEERYVLEERTSSRDSLLVDQVKQSVIYFIAYVYVMILGY
jgi:hypothetical protein